MSRDTYRVLAWYERPLRCLFGRHTWRAHPSDTGRGKWCTHCHEERWEQ